jgi:hypothetical protein
MNLLQGMQEAFRVENRENSEPFPTFISNVATGVPKDWQALSSLI